MQKREDECRVDAVLLLERVDGRARREVELDVRRAAEVVDEQSNLAVGRARGALAMHELLCDLLTVPLTAGDLGTTLLHFWCFSCVF